MTDCPSKYEWLFTVCIAFVNCCLAVKLVAILPMYSILHMLTFKQLEVNQDFTHYVDNFTHNAATMFVLASHYDVSITSQPANNI